MWLLAESCVMHCCGVCVCWSPAYLDACRHVTCTGRGAVQAGGLDKVMHAVCVYSQSLQVCCSTATAHVAQHSGSSSMALEEDPDAACCCCCHCSPRCTRPDAHLLCTVWRCDGVVDSRACEHAANQVCGAHALRALDLQAGRQAGRQGTSQTHSSLAVQVLPHAAGLVAGRQAAHCRLGQEGPVTCSTSRSPASKCPSGAAVAHIVQCMHACMHACTQGQQQVVPAPHHQEAAQLLCVLVRVCAVRQQAGVIAVDDVVDPVLLEQALDELGGEVVRHACSSKHE